VTLTFGATGSGSGTMAIVVNGVTYSISITSGMTAARAAELFRIAAKDSAHFVVFLNDAVATLISKTTSSDIVIADAEVNITSAPTTAGITATIGTRADRYPLIISELTAEIAAALLLMDNYGPEAQDTPKDGEKRLYMAKKELKQLQGTDKNDITIDIYDEVTGLEVPSSDGEDQIGYFPDDESAVSTSEPTAARLTINDSW